MLAALSVLAASGDAQAQSAQLPRPEVTVPLPNGEGVLYHRAGEPGGVRIRRRPAQPDSAPPPAPAGLDRDRLARVLREALADLRTAPEASGGPALVGGATRADIARLERAVERISDRLDDLAALSLSDRPRDRRDLAPYPVAPGVPVAPAARPQQEPLAPEAARPPDAPPAPEAPLDPVQIGAVSVEEIERAILDTGLFRTSRVPSSSDRPRLLPEAQRVLDAVGERPRALPRAPHRDRRPHGRGLAPTHSTSASPPRRAAAVRDYLLARFGLDPARLEAVGYGEAVPVASNETETGRALNRRVEFVVLNPEAAVRETQTTRPAEDDLRQRLREILREELEPGTTSACNDAEGD